MTLRRERGSPIEQATPSEHRPYLHMKQYLEKGPPFSTDPDEKVSVGTLTPAFCILRWMLIRSRLNLMG